MVDSPAATILKDPVTVIQSLFEEATIETRPQPADDYGVPQLFEDTFERDSELAQVPLLRDIPLDERLKSSGRLVRTVCYVTHSDSEIYGGAFRYGGKWHFGRYGLDAVITLPESGGGDSEDIVFEERTSLQCRMLDVLRSEALVESMRSISIDTPTSRNHADAVTVKLYNEKEEGLLHACLDIVGVLEVTGTQVTVHSLITQNQRLSSLVSSLSPVISTTKSDVRADLLHKLESTLQGDAFAAELTLLNLCSSVAVRSPVLVGPIVLNIRNVDPATALAISTFISDIASNIMTFDMSIDSLNKSKLYPTHDGEEFSAGALQLPTDTAVVLNESTLSEGDLNERGVKNLQSLTELVNTQDLIFHFPFSNFNIPMDVSLLILSHSRCLLPSTISVPLKTSSVWTLNSTSSVQDMRSYLAHCRIQEIEISDQVSFEIQEDFVSRRKQGDTMDQEDLSMSLALGKEICKSYGRRQMTWDDYTRGQVLRRKIRDRSS